ncbi:MAG TPA: hypothetical protein PLN69_07305 [bacterium]|nr:hypothetical protein [bacterium]
MFEQFIVGFYRLEDISMPLFILLALSVAAVLACYLLKSWKDIYCRLIITVMFLPMIGAMMLKLLIDFPIHALPRISLCVAPLFFIAVAAGITKMRKTAAAGFCVPLIISMALGLLFYYSTLHTDINAARAFDIIEKNAMEGDIFLTLPPSCMPLYAFYGPDGIDARSIPEKFDPLKFNSVSKSIWNENIRQYPGKIESDVAGHERLWFLWCGGPRPGIDSDGSIENYLDNRYKVLKKMNYHIGAGSVQPGGLLKLYDLRY